MKNIEFSKLLLLCIMVVYFIIVGFGIIIGFSNPETIGDFYNLVKTPTYVAIGFYAWKAKSENIIKLNKSQVEKLKAINSTEERSEYDGTQ